MSDIRWNLDLKGEKKVQKGLNDTGDAAEKAGDQLEEMGEQATGAGKASEKAGGKFKDTADDLGHLERKLQDATKRYKELLGEFNRTGDSSLEKDLREAKRDVNKSSRLFKDFMPDEGGDAVGKAFAARLADGFRVASGALKGAGTAVGIGIAVAAAPAVGAGISAAVLGGVGAGGIIGGISLAANDPRVKDAASQVGDSLMDDLKVSAQPFVDPLLRSLEKVGNAGWADKLSGPFARLSAKVDPLADGLIGLADNALPGLTSAMDAAGPVLDVLAKHLPKIGSSIGDFFESVSGNEEAVTRFLDSFLTGVEGGIEFAGDFVSVLMEIYNVSYDIADALGQVEPKMEMFKRGTDKGSEGLRGFKQSADAAEAAVNDLDAATKRMIDRALGLEAAQDEAADGFARLAEQIKEQREEGVKGAGSLEGNTQAARDNREAMRGLVADYQELIVETTKAGGKTDQLREGFIKNAVAAGIARKEAERYAAVLFGIPTKINVSIAATIKAHGDMVAWSMFRQQERKDEENRSAPGRASGGPVTAGRTYWVGENGPELVTFGADGYVHNAAASQAMATSGRSGGSSMPIGGGVAYLAPAPNMPADLAQLARLMIPYFQIVMPEFGATVDEAMGIPTR